MTPPNDAKTPDTLRALLRDLHDLARCVPDEEEALRDHADAWEADYKVAHGRWGDWGAEGNPVGPVYNIVEWQAHLQVELGKERVKTVALEAEVAEERGTRERLSNLLDGVARAIRGEPKPLEMYGFADLPERAAGLVAEVAKLRRAAERAIKDIETNINPYLVAQGAHPITLTVRDLRAALPPAGSGGEET